MPLNMRPVAPAADGECAICAHCYGPDTSRDLDQIEVAERQTTTVYTGIRTFSMLPEQLSPDLTSLNDVADRLAVVVEMVVAGDGSISSTSIYRALVRNQAQLTYNSVGPWLEGRFGVPAKVGASADLEGQLKLQDEAAQILLDERHRLGALNADRVEAEAVISDGHVQGINTRKKNRATELIENFMIAANGVMARTLMNAGVPSIRRVVRTPERWPRIVELAARYGETLPAEADSRALNTFPSEEKRCRRSALHGHAHSTNVSFRRLLRSWALKRS